MCGFVLAHFKESHDINNKQNSLSKSCEKYIRNRGPTYQESYSSENLFCYQSVLSIQGDKYRSSKSNPVGSKKFILYNGEIYNYSSGDLTSNDTEILNNYHKNNQLNEYLKKTDGMYAICAVERLNDNENIIDIYRDLAGEKHLWYFLNEEVLLISSIPAIIIEYLRKFSTIEINTNVLKDYFKRRHLISPEDHPIKGIKQLLPGTHIKFKTNEWEALTIERRYLSELLDQELYKQLDGFKESDLIDYTKNAFSESITSMMDICSSRVNSSSIFSGGIDSSLSTYFINNFYDEDKILDVYTLLVNEKDSIAPNSKKMIKLIDKKERIKHNEINCEINNYYSSLIRSIEILGSPVNTHSIPSSYLVAKKAARDGNQVIYGGEGADELFMGYGCYLNFNNKSIYNCEADNFNGYPNITICGKIQQQINSEKKVISDLYKDFFGQEKYKNVIAESYADFSIQLPNVGLLSTDTLNSDLGIECRTPFTREALLRLGLSMPIKHKINLGKKEKTKIPLKNIFKGIFGADNLYPKLGFAGYPNECSKFLPKMNKWYVFDLLEINYEEEKIFSRDELWKLINVEFFLRKVIYNENF